MIGEGRNRLEEMVVRAQRGDPLAMREVLEWAAPRVERIVGSYTGFCEDGRDLAQEVLLEVWRSLKRLRDPGKFNGWLTRISGRRAIDFLRRRYKEEQFRSEENGVRLEDLPSREGADLLLEPLYGELVENLKTLIGRLPARYRLVLSLHLMRGLNAPEISRATGRNVNSVRSSLRRGMQRLRSRWGNP